MAWWAWALRLTSLGWYIALCIILGIVGGLWLDRRFDTLPLFTLLGTVLGSVVAFYGVYRLVQPLLGQDRSPGKTRKKEGKG